MNGALAGDSGPACPACEGTVMLGPYLATFECCSGCRTLFQRPMPTAEQLAGAAGIVDFNAVKKQTD